jgi:aminoglycoside/choline kinase family phosphotransferase
VRGGVRNEVGFYAELQPTVSVRAPRCWYAAATADALQFTLLIEDLAPRSPGGQADGCSIDQAHAALHNLAGLHAPRWNDETLFELGFLRKSNAAGAAVLGATTMSATDVFLDRYGSLLSAEDVDTIRATAAAIESWLLLRPKPFSLLHGDYRLDNLMFDNQGGDVVAVDWQTLMIGPPARDVAYFLGTSLDVEARRNAERQLLAAYHGALVSRGVQQYSEKQCFEDYRLGQLQGPMITTIGSTYATADRTPQSDGMFLAMARRSCEAIRDLGSLSLL